MYEPVKPITPKVKTIYFKSYYKKTEHPYVIYTVLKVFFIRYLISKHDPTKSFTIKLIYISNKSLLFI